jgi:succinate dehydrogenase/fumarate reductase flavoprotein subunit
MAYQVIVVGGGLAGLSAAHTVLQAGGRVLVLDKSAFCGGNSTKATSGINAAGTRAQRALGIPDSPEQFEKDTLASAESGARPDLIHTLTHESGPAVEWLVDSFGLDLSVVGLLAAHAHPRTHRGKDGSESFPGMMITYRLMERLDEIIAEGKGVARLVTKATVTRLLRDGQAVVGVEYEVDGQKFLEYGPVVISTGGFGADFTSNSLLSRVEKEWRTLPAWKDIPLPALLSLPTTNGPHCTGDVCICSCAVFTSRVSSCLLMLARVCAICALCRSASVSIPPLQLYKPALLPSPPSL